ncbi:MAG: hypothetical protein MKZ53_00520 [Candidatus Thalassarchaeum sp.]|nr:hypothetical protein [Candidatus Thalassarchaeum sp.]
MTALELTYHLFGSIVFAHPPKSLGLHLMGAGEWRNVRCLSQPYGDVLRLRPCQL